MNIYKISFHTAGLGDNSVEARGRNEAEAKKNFKATEIGKATPINSITIELIRENVLATKQEERDTLAAIRQMVEELGPQSYLATAFDGCFRDAEDNIDDDAAYSMKSRFEYSEEKLEKAQAEVEELKSQLAQAETEISLLSEKLEKAENSRPTPEDFDGIFQLITLKRIELETEIKNAADRIVEAATDPESAAFKNAVSDHRAAQSEMDRYTALSERLGKIR